MNDDTKPFLNEGLKVYPEARATLLFFEQEIINVLAAAVARREQWHPLKNHRVKSNKADKNAGQGGFWVSMDIEGLSQRDEQINIDCGIWWKALENDDCAIIYASFSTAPKQLFEFQRSQQESGIRNFDRWDRTFFYISVMEATDIGKSLNLVLNELLKQLS